MDGVTERRKGRDDSTEDRDSKGTWGRVMLGGEGRGSGEERGSRGSESAACRRAKAECSWCAYLAVSAMHNAMAATLQLPYTSRLRLTTIGRGG